MKQITWIHALVTFLVFLLFMVFVLPNESAKSADLGLENSPDTSLFYTATQLYDTAEQYGVEGRAFYVRQRFTFDLVWPLVYGSFLFASTAYFGQGISGKRRRILVFLPVIAVAFDYLENIMTATVMNRFPLETFLFANLAGFATSLKWIALSISFLVVLILLGSRGIQSFKKEKAI